MHFSHDTFSGLLNSTLFLFDLHLITLAMDVINFNYLKLSQKLPNLLRNISSFIEKKHQIFVNVLNALQSDDVYFRMKRKQWKMICYFLYHHKRIKVHLWKDDDPLIQPYIFLFDGIDRLRRRSQCFWMDNFDVNRKKGCDWCGQNTL